MAKTDAFAALLAQVADGVLVVDDGGIVCEANDRAALMLDQSPADLIGKVVELPLDRLPPGEVPIRKANGEPSHATLRVTTIERDGRSLRLVTLSDSNHQEDAGQLQAQVDEANLLAEIGKKASIIGHDVNNALGALLGNSMLIAKHVDGLAEFFKVFTEDGSSHLSPATRAWLDDELDEYEVMFTLQEMGEIAGEDLATVRRIAKEVKGLTRGGQRQRLDASRTNGEAETNPESSKGPSS